jgi:hypothetical protein
LDDAYKCKIDDCGISGDHLEDQDFLPIEETLGLRED